MVKKVIVTAAITGAVHIPSMTEYLPVTPEQIADEAVAAYNAGAAIVHIHARDPETGKPASNPALVKQITDTIRNKCDVVIGITTGGAIGMSVEERLAAVPRCRAELASCNAGSVNFCFSQIADKIKEPKYDWEIPFVKNTYGVPFSNTFRDIEEYIRVMGENNTKPEFEVYDVGMLNNIAHFVKKGALKGKVYIQYVLGIMGGLPANIDNLVYLHNTAQKTFGDNYVWSCAAAGKEQFDLVTAAMLMGGNVRVGLEDNIFLSKNVLSKSNGESVAKIVNILKTLDREIATPDEARQILELK